MNRASFVLTFHDEGEIASRTLLGARRVLAAAASAGIAVECVAVLDNADMATRRLVNESGVPTAIVETSHGDAGDARNAGISASRGDWISVCDGDDHMSGNWLVESLLLVSAEPHSIIHPEYDVSFGDATSFQKIPDSISEPISDDLLMGLNPWPAAATASRRIFEEFPYVATRTSDSGYGYEDWHWNLETLAGGHPHRTAPQTCRFYRRKLRGRFAKERVGGAILRRTSFFDSPRFA